MESRTAAPDGLRRLLILGSALVFFDVLLFSVFPPLLPHLVDQLSLSKTEAGTLSAAYTAGALLAAVPAGFLANRVGPRLIIQIGLGGASLGCVFIAFGETLAVIDSARFLQGASGALIWSGALTWLISAAPATKRGRVIGTAIGTGIGGALLGPALGALSVGAGTEPVFGAIAIVAVALMWSTTLLEDVHVVSPQTPRAVAAIVRTRPMVEGIIFDATPALAFGVLAVLAPLRMNSIGAAAGVIAAVFIVAAALEALAAPAAGHWTDRAGSRVPYVIGLIICALALVVVAVAGTLATLVPAVLLASIGGAFTVTAALTMLSEAAEAQGLYQGFGVAVANFAWSLGLTLGALGGGALAGGSGNVVALLSVVAILAVTAAYARIRAPQT